MTDFLASVNTVQEAILAEQSGVDIIDLKNPDEGALGALPPGCISDILNVLVHSTKTSATIGDLPFDPRIVIPAVHQTAKTGVDYIKIGLFPGENFNHCLDELNTNIIQHKLKLIAVVFADYTIDDDQINAIARAGFYGVMLDTANKASGSLGSLLSDTALDRFIQEARQLGLFCGLAGSLSIEDIPRLIHKQPDYLGFRGALCDAGQRTAGIQQNRINAVRNSINMALQHTQNDLESTDVV